MNARLLIVEDDAGIRSGLVRALTNAGYDCAASASAEAARAAVASDDAQQAERLLGAIAAIAT